MLSVESHLKAFSLLLTISYTCRMFYRALMSLRSFEMAAIFDRQNRYFSAHFRVLQTDRKTWQEAGGNPGLEKRDQN